MGQSVRLVLKAISISSRPSFSESIQDPIYLVALGFGSGLSPKAPGTAGTVAALLPYFFLSGLPWWGYLFTVVVAFMFGVAVCELAATRLGIKDPGMIVWDEFVGLWIALFMVPDGWYFVVCGFLLFRFFDITKPWPVGRLDKTVSGGLGIMADDVAAGVYALAGVQLLGWFF